MKLDDSFKAIKQQAEQLKCGAGRAETQGEQLYRDAKLSVALQLRQRRRQSRDWLTEAVALQLH